MCVCVCVLPQLMLIRRMLKTGGSMTFGDATASSSVIEAKLYFIVRDSVSENRSRVGFLTP